VTSTIRRDNWFGIKSLWLGFRISAYGQDLGSSFRFSGSVFRVKCKLEADNCLPALKPLQHLSRHVGLSCCRCHEAFSIYMVVLANVVEGSFDVKRAQCNWTKMRTLQLCVYTRFRTTGLGVLCCWL